MALNYIYKKDKDIYTIENIGSIPLAYSIDIKNCETSSFYKAGIISPNTTEALPITYTDAIYIVTLSDDLEEEILPEIVQYNNTLLYLIKNIEEVLCGCEDCDCNDCEEVSKCFLNLNTLISVLAFSSVNTPKYSNYLYLINDYLKCDISTSLSCYTNIRFITGKQEEKNLFMQIIGLYYLAFYYTDLHQATGQEEITYVKTKYKFSKISLCLKRLGINLTTMEKIFFDYPVYYWQLTNTSDDISDVLPLLNEAYLLNKPVETFKIFNQGKSITYSSVGRIVFTIKNADSANFTITDILGNDVTSQFDTNYNPTTKYAVFVSKIFYSYSTIEFKIKQQNT